MKCIVCLEFEAWPGRSRVALCEYCTFDGYRELISRFKKRARSLKDAASIAKEFKRWQGVEIQRAFDRGVIRGRTSLTTHEMKQRIAFEEKFMRAAKA